jgi:hypothetical protein
MFEIKYFIYISWLKFKNKTMKNIAFLISLLFLFASCENEPVDFYLIENNDYIVALDTLVNYDNYFIGEFNGKVFVSNYSLFSRNVSNILQDSVTVSFSSSYIISNSQDLKTPFISFLAYESKTKLDSSNHYRYNEYSDFYEFFNRNEVEYLEVYDYKNLTPEVLISYIDYSQIINNTGVSYVSSDFDKPPFNENNFHIETIREIENPYKGIVLTYSFNCSLLSDSNELIEIKKGKGKCTFWY